MHFIALSFKIHCWKKNPLENSKLKLWCLKWEQWIKWSFRNPIILIYPRREVTVIVRIWIRKLPTEGRIECPTSQLLAKEVPFQFITLNRKRIETHLKKLKLEAAAAAKSLQSCPTLCDPMDGSPPGSAVPGILQARTWEWFAISFSNEWKWKVKVKSLSRVRLLATPWIAAYQAPPSMGFSRQEYWSGVPLPSPKLEAAIHKTVKFKITLKDEMEISLVVQWLRPSYKEDPVVHLPWRWSYKLWSPHATTREKPAQWNKKFPHDTVKFPRAATKTQCSQINKYIKINK